MDQGRTFRALALGAAILGMAAAGQSQIPDKYHSAGLWAGRSFKIFGSHEIRDTLGFFYGAAKEDRRLKHGSLRGQVVYEAYGEFNSNTGDLEVLSPYQTGALGGLALCRWLHKGMFFDLGIGLQLQNHVGSDLPSYVNSTPTAGFGWVIKSGDRPWLLGVRYLHISNAGTHKKNAGQNQILLYVSVLSF